MKDFKVYVILASLVMVVYLVAQLQRPKPFDWRQTYSRQDKIPFGTFVLYNQLNDIFPGASIKTTREPAYNILHNSKLKHATYIVIGGQTSIDSLDMLQMLSFVSRGNDVFIASHYIGEHLSDTLKTQIGGYDFTNQRSDTIRFVNKKLSGNSIYQRKKEYDRASFEQVDTLNATAIVETNKHKITYIRYKIGKGSLFINTDPEMFSNYSMLSPDGADYAAKALSYLRKDGTIIWDEYYTLGREGEQSMMRVFLTSPSLKWAYYVALVSLFIYVLYQVKRRQRIIPVMPPLENSTVGFVTVVGQVYYERRDNKNIADKKITYFNEHLRDRYQLNEITWTEGFIKFLANKTGIDHQLADKLTSTINFISKKEIVLDQELIKLNDLIETFHKQTGAK